MATYRIIIEEGEDFGYVAHCPAIPGCHSQGETVEKAVENMGDAIRGCISVKDRDLIVPAKRVAAMEVEV
jgi:predicted RNase H-like HicB family nuclease